MSPSFEEPGDLTRFLRDVDGWLTENEAWALFQYAREAGREDAPPVLVDIGSYLGRSAITMGLAVNLRGVGRVVTVDPQPAEQFERLQTNLHAKGVAGVVEAWSAGSAQAADRIEPGTVDLLFLDGDHSYDGAIRDMVVWQPKLAHGAVVGINDPFWGGVNRMLRDYVFALPSPFREPRLIDNTMFVSYRPGASLTRHELELFPLIRRFLRRGRAWHVLDVPLRKRPVVPKALWKVGRSHDLRTFPRLMRRAAMRADRRHQRRARRGTR
jgi:hypothetical protein